MDHRLPSAAKLTKPLLVGVSHDCSQVSYGNEFATRARMDSAQSGANGSAVKKSVGIASVVALGLVVAFVLGSTSAPRASAAGTGGDLARYGERHHRTGEQHGPPTDPYSGFNCTSALDLRRGCNPNQHLGKQHGHGIALSWRCIRYLLCILPAGSRICLRDARALRVRRSLPAACSPRCLHRHRQRLYFGSSRAWSRCDRWYLHGQLGRRATVQSNVVSSAPANIPVGSGTAADCAGIVIATPTATSSIPTLTPTNTPVPTLTPTKTPVPATYTPTSTPGGPTNTAVPTDTPTIVPPSNTPTSTPTDVPTSTPCAGECPTPTETSAPRAAAIRRQRGTAC